MRRTPKILQTHRSNPSALTIINVLDSQRLRKDS
jgi:hypothetical protein